jgi:hypothetical protein
MRPRALLSVVAVALLVAQAGCAGLNPGADATTPSPATDDGPTTTGTVNSTTSTTTTSTQPSTTTEQSLPVDPEAVFQRVETLLGVDATQPTVRVRQPEDDLTIEPVPDLVSLVGAAKDSGDPRKCMPETVGLANASTVVVSTDGLTAAGVELLLVHEYVHAIQYQSAQLEVQAPMRDTLTKTIGGRTTSRAIVEGAAVYVSEAYAREHDLAWTQGTPMEMRRCLYEHAPRGVGEIYAQYYFGGEHFAARLDSPANLSAVYQRPPRTAEELLHGLERGSEPPAALNVTVADSGDWRVAERGHRGELFVRALLANQLPDDRAARAAAGWGEDVAVLFGEGTESAQAAAWVLRFDTAADADEFAAAFDAAASGDDEYPFVRRERIGSETVVVVAGDQGFVSSATVSGSSGNVTVSPPS